MVKDSNVSVKILAIAAQDRHLFLATDLQGYPHPTDLQCCATPLVSVSSLPFAFSDSVAHLVPSVLAGYLSHKFYLTPSPTNRSRV